MELPYPRLCVKWYSSCSSDLTKYWGKFCFIQTRNISWSTKWVRFAQGHKVCSGGSHQHAVWFHSLWVSISQALFGSLNPFIPFKVKSHYMLTEIMFSQNNYIFHSNVKNSTGLILKTPKETLCRLGCTLTLSEELPESPVHRGQTHITYISLW